MDKHEAKSTLITMLWDLWHWIVGFFLAPGEAMMRSLSHTSWGREWGAEPSWEAVAICSLLFWVVVCALLGAMDDRVRGFLNRNNRKRD